MNDPVREPMPELDQFRSYLLLLASTQVGARSPVQVDPHDAVQQTLLTAHQKLPQFRGRTPAELAGWLRTILVNHVKDKYKRAGREVDEQALAMQLEQSSVRLDKWLTAEQSSPSQRVARGERWQQLADALMTLPDDQRQAIELRHLQGLSMVDISERMERSAASVGGLLQRGLKALRESMRAAESG